MPNENPITPLSAEEKVKAKWPDAICVQSFDGFCRIWNGLEAYAEFKMLSKAETEWQAWQDAASRLEAGSHAQ